jgi:intein/homing endonuclease
MKERRISKEFAEIIGLLCAEGSYVLAYDNYWGKDRGRRRFLKNKKSERLEFSNKDIKLLSHFQKLLFKEFNYKPNVTKHSKINICRRDIIRTVLAQTEIGHLKWKVPQLIKTAENSVKIGFLRGFFDGDGTVSNNIRFFSTNKLALKQISILLSDLEFIHYMPKPQIKPNRKPLYSIQISNKERERFLKMLKPVSKRPELLRGLS